MFEGIIHPFDDILNIIIASSALLFALSYAWSMYKGGSVKANAEALITYKNEVEALKLTITRKDGDIARITRDIVDLQAQLNQLKGENQALQKTLSLRDPGFESTFNKLACSIKDMRDDLRTHYESDKQEFSNIKEIDDRKMKVLESILNNQNKFIIPKLKNR